MSKRSEGDEIMNSKGWKPAHTNRYRLKKYCKELDKAIAKAEEEEQRKKKGYPCDWQGRIIKEVK